jgi:hypothetical protein
MSEKKPRRHSNVWALNLSNPDDPLLKCLTYEGHASNLVRVDGSINKSRLIEDLIAEALQVRFQKRGYMEGLGLLQEHARRRAVKEAIATGKPLPPETLSPQPVPQTSAVAQQPSASEPAPTTTPIPQTVPTPKPPEKKPRREGIFMIGSSGHMRKTGE